MHVTSIRTCSLLRPSQGARVSDEREPSLAVSCDLLGFALRRFVARGLSVAIAHARFKVW
jgi:hypothetical protein